MPAHPALVDVRSAAVESAIVLLRRQALHEVSLRSVADAAGLSRREVEAVFPRWEDLLQAVVSEWNGRRTGPLLPIAASAGAVAFLRAIVRANAADPALMRLLIATVNIAATPGQPMAPWLLERWRGFYDLVRSTLEQDVAVGREAAAMDPVRGAEQLIALYEGLQTQSTIRTDMDPVDAFDLAVARLRTGWSAVAEEPAAAE